MASERDELIRELKESEESRRDFALDYVDASIALQIKVLRQDREDTQSQLAERAGLFQSQISDYENVNNGSWTGETLKKLAAGFDLPLIVTFGSWGDLLDRFSKLGRSDLERPPIHKDPAFGGADTVSLAKILPYPAATGASSGDQPPSSVRPVGQLVGSASS